LLENIKLTRLYGDSETRRADRAQILSILNQLAIEIVGISFNQLTYGAGKFNNTELTTKSSQYAQIQLVISRDLTEFDHERRLLLKNILASILMIDPSEVKILEVKLGSVRVIIEIPEEKVSDLFSLLPNDQLTLISQGVIAISYGKKTINISVQSEVETSSLLEKEPIPATQVQDHAIDFVLVTALEEERDALLSKIPNFMKLPQTEGDISVYYYAEFPLPTSENPIGIYRIVLITLLGMGQLQATTATVNAIQRWMPRYILLIGIAGGVATNGIKLGDILIANQIVDYELQKITPEGTDIRWEVHRTDPRLLGTAQNLRDDEWKDLISEIRPDPGLPKRHIGPIASGNKVIAFNDVLEKFKDIWAKLVGVEMEASGVATASFQAGSRPGFFMIRGVSDLADKKKNSARVKKWRLYACDVAAAYAIGLLRCMPLEPRVKYRSDHQDSGYIKNEQQQEIHALITQAYEILDDLLFVFTSGGDIYPDQCENTTKELANFEKGVNKLLSIMPSQYKTLISVIHLQQHLKTITEILAEFTKTCPPGNSHKRIEISDQIELIKNSLSYLKITINAENCRRNEIKA
jgi:nucleoside phosphorylase